MEEIEVPTEHLHEHIHEAAEHETSKSRWSLYLAISTALMAVLAALASLQAGHHSNEALISRVLASDQWGYFQAKGIKSDITQLMMASKTGQDTIPFHNKLMQYKSEKEKIKTIAEDYEKESTEHLDRHIILARSVTFFQVSIALSAISILTRKRFMWYFSLALTLIGVWQFIMGNI